MTPVQLLIAVGVYAAKYGPEVVRAVEEIIAEIKRDHPELLEPPPVDEEATIDAAIDNELGGHK